MPQPNQIDRECEDVRVAAADLLAVPQGVITEAGLRQNINVAIGYIEAWLRRLRPALPPDGGRSVALRSGWLARTRRADADKPVIEKLPIDLARQPHQRMAEVDDVFQRRP
jgi:hypothetical protein